MVTAMRVILVTLTAAFACLSAFAHAAPGGEVNVYSGRQENLIKPVLDRFAEQTGITVKLITGDADALIARMASEGRLSPADVLIAADVGRLYRAMEQDLLRPMQSGIVAAQVPERLRDAQGHWVALTLRARPIMYVADRVSPAELSTLEDLADPRWKGRICVRSSSNIYNQSMLAALIEQIGAPAAEQWARGLVNNFAQPPRGGDRDQIKAAAAGLCDIAIANTYYLAGMLQDADAAMRAAAEKVKVFWPNQQDRGVHVNISGAGVARHAPNARQAQALIEFMLEAESQAWYAQQNHEYPVRADVPWSEVLKDFGAFKTEQIPLTALGRRNAEAIRVLDRAGWK